MLGTAIQEGLVENIDQDVYSFFPKEKYPSLHEDYKKIKIRHLLDMASGLDADSDDNQTPGHVGRCCGQLFARYVSLLLSRMLAARLLDVRVVFSVAHR